MQEPEANVEPAASPAPIVHLWTGSHYVVREKRFTFGRQYYILDAANRPIAFCKQKAFKAREDIRFYADESKTAELFRLNATKVLDFKGNFVVTESSTGRVLGTLRRKGWRSLVRDEWQVVDAEGNFWGVLREDHPALAVARRIVGFIPDLLLLDLDIIPMSYTLRRGPDESGEAVARLKERFQLFGDTYDLTLQGDPGIDHRVLVGLAICMDAIEGE